MAATECTTSDRNVPAQSLAPAKINLFLHVGPRQADGYHPISSLMIFANIGDELGLTPGAPMGLTVEGPFGASLSDGGDNLVLRARDLFLDRFGRAFAPFGLTLDKRLPIAAGLGGGSADAAATLQLLARHHGVDSSHPSLDVMARALGADVAACFAGRTVVAEGRGDELTPAPLMPALDAVLVNPGAPSSTAAVYGAFDDLPAGPGADRPALPPGLPTARRAAEVFNRLRNDLEAPALVLQPLIGEALRALADQPETLLARMSGSGATSFALVETPADARRLAARFAEAHPTWWVRPCRLG